MTVLTSIRQDNKTKPHQALVLPVFVASLFLSAFLLFSVQPMFTKMVLPILGGSPSVWSVAMVFFQSALLAGYAYAHFLSSRLSHGASVLIHLVTLACAALMLPIGIAAGYGTPPSGHTALWLIGLFTLSVGLPFFTVSTNGPLLQAWFSRSGHAHADDPYFLYGASNIGSFAALLLYPLLFEPLIGASQQSMLWACGFALMSAMIACCGYLVWRQAPAISQLAQNMAEDAPSGLRILHWTVLSFIPSALLVGVTAHLSTDVASSPFLWVLPLALFLATFVIVFQRKPILPHPLVMKLQPIAVAALVIPIVTGWNLPLPVTATLHLVTFFFCTMLCHGEMVSLRPKSAYLTTFYLVMSAGGALGGLFSGLIAPNLFNSVVEYPMMITAALLLHPTLWRADTRREKRSLLITLAAFAAIGAPLNGYLTFSPKLAMSFVLCLSVCAVLVITFTSMTKRVALSCLMLLLPGLFNLAGLDGDSVRSFFGVHRVRDMPQANQRILMHGTTIHGVVRLSDMAPESTDLPMPTGYYTFGGPLGQGLDAARAQFAPKALNVGAIGLGAGTIACQSKPNENWTFFEIDPEVIRIARDTTRFPFLARCTPNAAIELGDARLLLADRRGKSFDHLLVDAFSSDAIPTHLMTVEAMEIYLRNLSAHGSVLFHISNRHMELASVVAAIAARKGMVAYTRTDKRPLDPENMFRYPSIAVITARSESDIAAVVQNPDWHKVTVAPDTKAWTDDHANVLGAIWRKYQGL